MTQLSLNRAPILNRYMKCFAASAIWEAVFSPSAVIPNTCKNQQLVYVVRYLKKNCPPLKECERGVRHMYSFKYFCSLQQGVYQQDIIITLSTPGELENDEIETRARNFDQCASTKIEADDLLLQNRSR
jgi:hypothetical protein